VDSNTSRPEKHPQKQTAFAELSAFRTFPTQRGKSDWAERYLQPCLTTNPRKRLDLPGLPLAMADAPNRSYSNRLPFSASRQIWQHTRSLKRAYPAHLVSANYWNGHLKTFCDWALAETEAQASTATSTRVGERSVVDSASAAQLLGFRQDLLPLQTTTTAAHIAGLPAAGDPNRMHWDTTASFNALPSSAQGLLRTTSIHPPWFQ